MRYEDVKARVRGELGSELDTLYAEFTASGGSDLVRFVAFLKETGRISEHTFREIHAGERPDLTAYSSLAEHSLADVTLFPDDLEDVLPTEEVEEALPTEEVVRVPPVPVIGHRYQYLGKVGEGAMGEVHVALETTLNRKVAFKQMSKEIADSGKLASRFFNEAQITAQLDHPNIVPVYALETSADGRLGYSMKLIRGRTFKDITVEVQDLYEDGHAIPEALSLEARIEAFLKVCDALEFAHSRGVVHRDLKPENIMVGPFNEVYLMDWGIARLMGIEGDAADDAIQLVSGPNDDNVSRTRLGTVIGTPAYMSPEQAEGRNHELDGRSDLFAMGLILFELVSLNRAVRGMTAMDMIIKLQDAKLEPLVHFAGIRIDPRLAAIIEKATQKDRGLRYESMEACAQDLRRWLRDEEVLARPDTRFEAFGRWIGNHLALATTAVGVIVTFLSLVVIGVLWLNVQNLRAAETREVALSSLLTAVSRQGAVIDSHLLEYEGLLQVLAATALEGLERKAEAHKRSIPSFVDAEGFPAPDLTDSPRYDRPISPTWPVFRYADAMGYPERSSVAVLVGLRDQYRRVMLRSAGTDVLSLSTEEQDRLLLEGGLPFAWSYVSLENGTHSTFPGHTGVPPGFDGRRRPWYKQVEDATEPTWGNPHVDLSGLGLMLPCSIPLITDEGERIGVAAVEVTFDYLLDELLVAEDLEETAEAFIVDQDGHILIRSGETREISRRAAETGRALRLKSFPVNAVERAVQERPSGYVEVDVDGVPTLAVFYRMEQLGWSYVVMGPTSTLLGL